MKMATASVIPLPDNHNAGPLRFAAEDAAVVLIVNVATPEVAPVIETGDVPPKLSVGRFVAPLGEEVIDALSATLPVKPFAGCTVIFDVFPLPAPFVTVTAVQEVLNVGGCRLMV